jgi:hypothetical protein
MKEPIIGEIYECIDTIGMSFSRRRYIGKGRQYRYYKSGEPETDWAGDWIPTNDDYYYIFENKMETDYEKACYKYAAAVPIFSGLEWTGKFQVKYYSNDLPNILNSDVVTKFMLNS